MKRPAFFIILILIFSASYSAQDTLTINVDGHKTTYTAENLLKNPNTITINKARLPTYPNQFFDLKVIPLCSLLNIDKKVGTILKISASDNYVSYFNLHRIYPCDPTRASTAYIAIENPNKPWPIVNEVKHSAGPFYLIWRGKKVQQTDWVFQMEYVTTTNENPFSALLPANSTGQEAQGLEQFSSKCGVCHSINLIGNLELAPDLNFPMNPTEYFSEKHLRQFIRNPQSVRYMKNDKMFPFTQKILSEQELDAIIAFLKLMRSHKIKTIPQHLIPTQESVE